MSDHYFCDSPSSADTSREITVVIDEKEYLVQTMSGVFSNTRLDPGTTQLLRHLSHNPQAKEILDLGCGWGPITLALANLYPDGHIYAVDVNPRARELTLLNARRHNFSQVEVLDPLSADTLDLEIDEIWSNPPVRIGKSALQEITLKWLAKLRPTGRAVLVMNKNLGADSYSKWLVSIGWEVTKLGSAKGFRVWEVRRAKR